MMFFPPKGGRGRERLGHDFFAMCATYGKLSNLRVIDPHSLFFLARS